MFWCPSHRVKSFGKLCTCRRSRRKWRSENCICSARIPAPRCATGCPVAKPDVRLRYGALKVSMCEITLVPLSRLPHIYVSSLSYYAIPLFLIIFTNYAQLSSPLCPMCTQRLRDSSDRVGALSRSSSDTVDSEDVDSASMGILSELWYELLQESDVAILVLVGPSVSNTYTYTTFTIHVGVVQYFLPGSKVK